MSYIIKASQFVSHDPLYVRNIEYLGINNKRVPFCSFTSTRLTAQKFNYNEARKTANKLITRPLIGGILTKLHNVAIAEYSL